MTLDDAWMDSAACKDIPNADDVFFPPIQRGGRADYKPAKMICRACPVRTYCLAYAIAHGRAHGVWGGFSPPERRRIPAAKRLEVRRAWWRTFPTTKLQSGGR